MRWYLSVDRKLREDVCTVYTIWMGKTTVCYTSNKNRGILHCVRCETWICTNVSALFSLWEMLNWAYMLEIGMDGLLIDVHIDDGSLLSLPHCRCVAMGGSTSNGMPNENGWCINKMQRLSRSFGLNGLEILSNVIVHGKYKWCPLRAWLDLLSYSSMLLFSYIYYILCILCL